MADKLIHKQLSNGLNIYLCPLKNKHSTMINLIVKYGGFHSDFIVDGINYHMNDGLAHLLEHLLYDKSSFRSALGMNSNGQTWPFITEYFVDTALNANYALEKLITSISCLSFTEEDLKNVKPAIYQEIKMAQDELRGKVVPNNMKNIFRNIPYNSSLGTIKMVEDFTYDEVKLCYDTFYQPKNEILFMAGNFDVSKTLELIEKIYSKLPFKNTNFAYKNYQEDSLVLKDYEKISGDLPKDYVSIWYKVDIKNISQDKRHLSSYYLTLFGKLNISSLSKKLIETKVIDTAITFGFSFYGDYLIFKVGSYVNLAEEFIKSVRHLLENEKEYDEQIFNLHLKALKTAKICEDSSPKDLGISFSYNVLNFDYPGFDSYEEISALNFSEYQNFIDNLDFKNYTITTVTK